MTIDHDSYVKKIYTEGKDTHFVYNSHEHPPFDPMEAVESVFNLTTLGLFIGFLAIYFILYYILSSIIDNKNYSTDVIKSHTINLTVVLLLFIGFLYFYFTLSKENQSHLFTHVMALFKDEMNNPNTIMVMSIFLILFYIFVYFMNFPMGNETKPFSLEIIEFKSWVYLIMLLFIVLIIYGFHFEIVDWTYYEMYKFFIKPVRDVEQKIRDKKHDKKHDEKHDEKHNEQSIPTEHNKEEVFNIANNLYTYDDAQAICTAYGARLATYDDIEKAYEAGGEWCNYGWSDGQMIFFPTQKNTWQNLQKDPTKKNNCGRPGINGGYMENPYIKFGVNCYGVKPKAKESEKNAMKTQTTDVSVTKPPTVDPNVQKWKSLLDTLTVNSYNKFEWSEYDTMNVPVFTAPVSVPIPAPTPAPVAAPALAPAFVNRVPAPAPLGAASVRK
jgi:hypothetical protein